MAVIIFECVKVTLPCDILASLNNWICFFNLGLQTLMVQTGIQCEEVYHIHLP